MQKVTLIGFVGNDAVVKTQKTGGKDFVSFSLAVTESYEANGAKKEKTTWYDCIYKHTGVASHLKKGTRLYVEGKPDYSFWTDQKNEKQLQITVSVRDLEFVSNKKDN